MNIKLHTGWTEEMVSFLKEKFPFEQKSIIINKLGKGWGAISQMANKFKLKRKCQYKRSHKNWPQSEIDKLIKFYPISNRNELKSLFPNKNLHSLEEYARKLSLKKDITVPFSRGRKGDLQVLLNDSVESYYWIGFIFADGYIHHKSNHLIIFIDELDKNHLQKYATYISGQIKTYISLKKFDSNSPMYKSVMCRVAVAQKKVVPIIIDKFGFKPTKTYNPPDVSILKKVLNTREKFLAFFAGFVDGDGSISKDYSSITIENHSSWTTIHQYFKSEFISVFNNIDDIQSFFNKNGYSIFKIKNKTLLANIKKELVKLQLPLMERKWSRININNISGKDKFKAFYDELQLHISKGLTLREISSIMNIKEPALRSYIHRKKIKYNKCKYSLAKS